MVRLESGMYCHIFRISETCQMSNVNILLQVRKRNQRLIRSLRTLRVDRSPSLPCEVRICLGDRLLVSLRAVVLSDREDDGTESCDRAGAGVPLNFDRSVSKMSFHVKRIFFS